jgi:hypothetical protein
VSHVELVLKYPRDYLKILPAISLAIGRRLRWLPIIIVACLSVSGSLIPVIKVRGYRTAFEDLGGEKPTTPAAVSVTYRWSDDVSALLGVMIVPVRAITCSVRNIPCHFTIYLLWDL